MAVLPKEIKIPVAGLMKGVTIKVKLTGYRRWHLRLRVGIVLMRFAIWLSGMGCEVEDSEPPELPDPNKPSAKALDLMMSPGFIGGKDKEEPTDAP